MTYLLLVHPPDTPAHHLSGARCLATFQPISLSRCSSSCHHSRLLSLRSSLLPTMTALTGLNRPLPGFLPSQLDDNATCCLPTPCSSSHLSVISTIAVFNRSDARFAATSSAARLASSSAISLQRVRPG